jgi:hypothetical protein
MLDQHTDEEAYKQMALASINILERYGLHGVWLQPPDGFIDACRRLVVLGLAEEDDHGCFRLIDQRGTAH